MIDDWTVLHSCGPGFTKLPLGHTDRDGHTDTLSLWKIKVRGRHEIFQPIELSN